jgi:hypothetical protein
MPPYSTFLDSGQTLQTGRDGRANVIITLNLADFPPTCFITETLLLPEFQRDFCWEMDQTESPAIPRRGTLGLPRTLNRPGSFGDMIDLMTPKALRNGRFWDDSGSEN